MARSKISQSSVVLISSLALFACAGQDDTPSELPGRVITEGNPSETPQLPNLTGYKSLIVAADESGNINFYGDNGAEPVTPIKDPKNKDLNFVLSLHNVKDEPYTFGEVHVVKTAAGEQLALVLVTSKVLAADEAVVGGGVAVIDLQRFAVAGIIPLHSDETGKISRPSSAKLSPDGSALWINNSPADDPETADPENVGADSVFVLKIADISVTTDADGKLTLATVTPAEFLVGDGAKQGTFSHQVGSSNPAVHDWFVTTNTADQTVTVFENGADMAMLMETLSLNSDGAAKRNAPTGVAFSPVSGKIYIGIASRRDVALATIDATIAAGEMPMLDLDTFKVGAAMDMQIPAAGYVTTTPNGDYVFTVGYVPGPASAPERGQGYLSIIDAQMNMVMDVVELGNLYANQVVVHEDEAGLKVFIPGADRTMVNPLDESVQMEVPGILNNQVAVVSIDHETGLAVPQAGEELVQYIEVPKGAAQRLAQFTPNGQRVIFPSGNIRECTAHHHPHDMPAMVDNDCPILTVVNVADNQVIAKLQMQGHGPGGIGIWEMGEPSPTSPPPTTPPPPITPPTNPPPTTPPPPGGGHGH